jgi:hypothetical protein
MPRSNFLRPRAPRNDVGGSGGGHGSSSTQIEPVKVSTDAIIRVVREENMLRQPCLLHYCIYPATKTLQKVQKLQLTTYQSIFNLCTQTAFRIFKKAHNEQPIMNNP